MQYGINQPNLSRPCPPIDVELVRSAVILAHPVAALCLIWAFYRQRAWRKESPSLSGAERKSAVEHHESMGDRIAMATLAIVVLAFASNAVRGVIDHDDPTRLLVPGHFHGWSGIIGVSMMFFLWRALGRFTWFFTLRQFFHPREYLLVMNFAEELMAAVQPGFVLVISFDGVPWGKGHVGKFEHCILGL